MNIFDKIKNNKMVGAAVTNIGNFYATHESTILTGGSIGFSLATTAVTFRNAPKITNEILMAKEDLAMCETEEERKAIYMDTLKRIVPLAAPILLFQTAQIACTIGQKKERDRKLAEAGAALTIANNVISQYKDFKRKAEEVLGEKKVEKVEKELAQERMNNINPDDVKQLPTTGSFLYHEISMGGNRLFYSDKSPSQIESECLELWRECCDGNCDNDEITVNDIYDTIDPTGSLNIGAPGDQWGFGLKDEDSNPYNRGIDISITPGELKDHRTLCYEINIEALPFRNRRW